MRFQFRASGPQLGNCFPLNLPGAPSIAPAMDGKATNPTPPSAAQPRSAPESSANSPNGPCRATRGNFAQRRHGSLGRSHRTRRRADVGKAHAIASWILAACPTRNARCDFPRHPKISIIFRFDANATSARISLNWMTCPVSCSAFQTVQ